MAPYEAWIREQVSGSEPGPAFPTQPPEAQSGLPEPMNENCTIALPGEEGRTPRCQLDLGDLSSGENCLGFRRPSDSGFSPPRVWESPEARGLALGSPGDGPRIQTLLWGTGV